MRTKERIETEIINLKLMYEHLLVALYRDGGTTSLGPILKEYGFPSVYGTLLGRLGHIRIVKGKGVLNCFTVSLTDSQALEVINGVTEYNKTHQEKETFTFDGEQRPHHLGHPNDDVKGYDPDAPGILGGQYYNPADPGLIPPASRYFDLDSSKERLMSKASEAKNIIKAKEKAEMEEWDKRVKEAFDPKKTEEHLNKLAAVQLLEDLKSTKGANQIGAIYIPGMDNKTDNALKKLIEREAAIKITRRFRIKLFGFKIFEIES